MCNEAPSWPMSSSTTPAGWQSGLSGSACRSDKGQVRLQPPFNVKDSFPPRHLGHAAVQAHRVCHPDQLVHGHTCIVRCIIDQVMAQKDGKYLIVKDPTRPCSGLRHPDNTSRATKIRMMMTTVTTMLWTHPQSLTDKSTYDLHTTTTADRLLTHLKRFVRRR